MSPVRVGIIGCGSIANNHARAYRDHAGADLVGVFDVDPDHTAAYVAEYDTTPYATAADLLAAGPDLVSIATPPGSHTELAEQCLRAGVSVLVEKPPTISLAELDRIAAAEAAGDAQAYVVFQHRHGSGARRAHDLLHRGSLGTPLVAVCETLWFRPDSYFDPEWRGTWVGEGGGPSLGHAIHQIDLLLHLLGPWEWVQSHHERLARPVEFEDVSLALVGFSSGAVATVVTSLLSPREVSRVRIDTTTGTLEVAHVYGYSDADWSWHPVPDAAVAATLGRDPGRHDRPAPTATSGDPWTSSAGPDRPSNHAAQIDTLIDDLHADRRHDTTLASTRPTMELVTALYASAGSGTRVRRDELVPGHPYYDGLDGEASR